MRRIIRPLVKKRLTRWEYFAGSSDMTPIQWQIILAALKVFIGKAPVCQVCSGYFTTPFIGI
ncbi:hypothetical protein YTPLAS18_18590 [Nitrospira sp.]|nr:hypothetical protein YTPLAS18_18590 [Nitrospira sp.]